MAAMDALAHALSLGAGVELILSNGRVVTRDAVFTGTIVIRDGWIDAIDEGRCRLPRAVDLDGDFLLPGLIELHTDNLERHIAPRPGVDWPALPALVAHDAEIASSGITTVLNGLRLGSLRGDTKIAGRAQEIAGQIAAAQGQGLFRAQHLIHVRCEVGCADVVDGLVPFLDDPLIKLVSVMDHTPGQRQFTSIEKYREYYSGKMGFTEDVFGALIDEARNGQARHSGPNRRVIVDMCRRQAIPLASHDDATQEHVDEAVADGMVIAEFPTTVEAARASAAAGLLVLMGGPNVVRGGSHSGNVAALDLARLRLLAMLSSDYIPSSLLNAAFRVSREVEGVDLPAAIDMVSRTPAEAIGLADRGEIAVGKRADLVHVHADTAVPVVRSVWREGRRVA